MSDKRTGAPKKQVHWANDYGDRPAYWYATREQAVDNRLFKPIAVIRREWVEGQLPQYFTEGV